MGPTHRSDYRLETVEPATALDRIWRAGLMENDEETSHVMPLACPQSNPDRSGVQHALLMVHAASGVDVGMAIISPPSADSCGRPELNVYVHHQHRGLGLGLWLVKAALQAEPAAAGFYSESSVGMYRALQLPCAWPPPKNEDGSLIEPQVLPRHLGPDNLTNNQRVSIELIEKDRQMFRASRPGVHRSRRNSPV